jgi:lysophospholipase L1-like esterase
MSVTSGAGQSAAQVSYPNPTVSGGLSPLSYKCSPPTSSSFPLGTTSVQCQVTDGQLHADACSFDVTVVAPPPPVPRLSGTNFVAFGDSMTEGLNQLSVPLSIPNPVGSYPADLLTMLSARYTAQKISVVDEGIGGETVAMGMQRLPGVLSADRPNALMLLEGVNDLNQFGAGAMPSVVTGLQSMVRTARGSGAIVFLATLPPQRPGGSRAYTPTLVEPMNDRIRNLAPSEGAILVDLYRDFNGQVDTLIGTDGLHPNAAGYQQMATSFFTAIRSQMEVAAQPVSPVNVLVQRSVGRTASPVQPVRSASSAH